MTPAITWRQPDSTTSGRLDAALTEHAAGISRSALQRAIREGRVTVDGSVVTRPSHQLRPGNEVTAQLVSAKPDGVSPNGAIQLCPVYEDADLVVLDKQAGITVHPGAGHVDDTLVNGLLARYPEMAAAGEKDRPGVVHRLDRDTSGLLVFALTARAHGELTRMVRDREVTRIYTAAVHGHITPEQGTVDAPVGRDPTNRTRQQIVDHGKPARTRYRLVETVGPASLLEVELDTGRMHQVRVHLAGIGFPVLGDQTYGGAPKMAGLDRQFLHSSKLRFNHPVTGQQIDLVSRLPHDLQIVLDALREA